MSKKKGTNTGIPGVSFSAKRAAGITNAKRKVAKSTGIPTTKSGRQRKVGKAATGGGCLIPMIIIIAIIATAIIGGCSKSEAEKNPYYEAAVEELQKKCDMSNSQAENAVKSFEQCKILIGKIYVIPYYGDYYTMTVPNQEIGGHETYKLKVEDGSLKEIAVFSSDEIIYSDGKVIERSKKAITEAATQQKPTEKATESTTEKLTDPPTEPETEKTTNLPVENEDYDLVVTNWTNTVEAGAEASVTIQGKPNTEYSISVFYHSGPSKAEGLESKPSDENGNVTWTWKVGAKTDKDTYDITVSGDGKHETVQFKVI